MAAQDMPPPGGYAHINIERTFPKPFMRQGIYALIGLGLTMNGIYVLHNWKRMYQVLKTEQVEHFIAVSPFLIAEKERNFLSHLYNLREDERKLMKNHEGWKLGTLYGEPVFKTLPPGALPNISPIDYYVHRTESEWIWNVMEPDCDQ